MISIVLCVVYVDVIQHIGCCDSAVVDNNIDVTVTVASVADDGHVTVSVNRCVSFLVKYVNGCNNNVSGFDGAFLTSCCMKSVTCCNSITAALYGFYNQAENSKISFKSNNSETYNNLFSLDELANAISISQDTAVGPDDIHYQMLKHLPHMQSKPFWIF